MTTLEYTVRFTTPAFLGNAQQTGQWRTPPFKALLRQWWRVAYAADHHFDVNVDAMRREEGLLFGNAWLSHKENGREVSDHCKSLVRIRLDCWEEGKLRSWQPLATVAHPEVRLQVGSDLYLGYGPVTLPRGGSQPKLNANAAIQADESAKLSLAVPEEHAPRIHRALWLMDRYGTLGGRSRNGWGSFTMTPTNGTPKLDGQVPVCDWKICLKADWPHAIGQDDTGPLIWQTAKAYDDWKTLMRDLAIIKIGLRTQFVFPNVPPPHPQPLERHWLSYPITRHTTRAFDRNARFPNSLRFKVRRTNDDKLVGVIDHVPCKPPSDFRPNPTAIQHTWLTVHQLLDELTKAGDRTYSMVTDAARRGQLTPALDKVVLKRIRE